jgi:hypothetical protein
VPVSAAQLELVWICGPARVLPLPVPASGALVSQVLLQLFLGLF